MAPNMVASLRDPGASELARHLSAKLNRLANWIIRYPPEFIRPSCRCPESGLSRDPKCAATTGVASTAKPRTTCYVVPSGCRAVGHECRPSPRRVFIRPVRRAGSRFSRPLAWPLAQSALGGTQKRQQRPGRPFCPPQYNQTGLHLNLNPDESSLFQEPTPTDPTAMTAHKAKSDIPPELRGLMAVVGEIL